jgi:hypothetical protein
LAIFFPSKQFLPVSFQIQLLEYFQQKQKEQRHKQNSRSTWQLPSDTAETKSEVAEMPGWDQANRGENLVWFGEIERKLAKLSMTTFTYRSSSCFHFAGKSAEKYY